MGKLTTMKYKTKRFTKNIDQIFDDLSTKDSVHNLKNQSLDEDLPGMGQNYCIECAKHFQNDKALASHRRGKVHKRRLKLIKEGPYSQLEAEAAAGNNIEKYIKKTQSNNQTLNLQVIPTIQLEKGTAQIKKKKSEKVEATPMEVES